MKARTVVQSLVLMAAVLLVSACAGPVRVSTPGEDPSASTPVKDLRPSSEREKETFSYLITSDSYGIFRKGDDAIDPRMIELFRREAYKAMGGADKQLDITVYHMVIYQNSKSALRSSAAAAAVGGAIGGAIAGVAGNDRSVNLRRSLVDRTWFEGLTKNEYERSIYRQEENPQHAPVYVVYIDAEINGRRTFVRAMSPTMIGRQDGFLTAVSGTIYYWLQRNQSDDTSGELYPYINTQ